MREEFEADKYNWSVYDDEFTKKNNLEAREKNEISKVLDMRTPGLFKNEFSADKVICLAAKQYYASPKKKSEKELKEIEEKINLINVQRKANGLDAIEAEKDKSDRKSVV